MFIGLILKDDDQVLLKKDNNNSKESWSFPYFIVDSQGQVIANSFQDILDIVD